MKGINQTKAKKKAKSQGKGSKGPGASKRSRRAHLHSENHAWNVARKLRTRGKRTQSQPPGFSQGKHVKGGICNCGGCQSKRLYGDREGYIAPK